MEKVNWLLKVLLSAYVTTMVLLFILAFGLYKFDLTEQAVQGGIIAIYVLSAFIGGRMAGKIKKQRRFAWGIASGGIYFLVLILISFLVYHSVSLGTDAIQNLMFCSLGGMAGGMSS